MEEILMDLSSDTVTLKYDSDTNIVTVNYSKDDKGFIEITNVDDIIFLEDTDMSEWEISWSDEETRCKVRQFYYENKVL